MSAPLTADVLALGLCAPGLTDVDAFRRWHADADAPLPAGHHADAAAARMAAGERRRAPHSVHLAIEVASQALGMRDAAAIGLIHCSAYGDIANTDALLQTLTTAPRATSPTRFTHSVHNAAAGHWSMASASHAAGTALAGGRDGFGPALLAALLQLRVWPTPLLLVLSDAAAVGALADAAPCACDFAAALLLAPAQASGRPRLQATLHAGSAAATAPHDARLLPWWQGNPAAQVLPLLEAIGAAARRDFTWPLGSGTLLRVHCESSP